MSASCCARRAVARSTSSCARASFQACARTGRTIALSLLVRAACALSDRDAAVAAITSGTGIAGGGTFSTSQFAQVNDSLYITVFERTLLMAATGSLLAIAVGALIRLAIAVSQPGIADVATAIRWARDEELVVAVRGGDDDVGGD